MNQITQFITKLINLLPEDPIRSYLTGLNKPRWLCYLNWFIPFHTLEWITGLWAAACIAFFFRRILIEKASKFISSLIGRDNEE